MWKNINNQHAKNTKTTSTTTTDGGVTFQRASCGCGCLISFTMFILFVHFFFDNGVQFHLAVVCVTEQSSFVTWLNIVANDKIVCAYIQTQEVVVFSKKTARSLSTSDCVSDLRNHQTTWRHFRLRQYNFLKVFFSAFTYSRTIWNLKAIM